MQKHEKNGITFFTYDNLSRAGIDHFISTRIGGESPSPWESLNLGLHVDDDPRRVVDNRNKLASALDMNLDQFTLAKQTHSDHVLIVDSSLRGRGSASWEDAIDDCDALITTEKECVVTVNIADCVPVLLADPFQKCVAAIHAGWKGTFARIVQKTVQKMMDENQCDPRNILAGIGPGICKECYEVDLNLYTRFKREFSDSDQIGYQKENHFFLDLPKINASQLEVSGIPSENIELSPYCTSCNNDLFYSHRKEKGSGRFWAGIWLA